FFKHNPLVLCAFTTNQKTNPLSFSYVELTLNSRTEKAVWRADIKETPARFVAEPSGCLIDLQEWRGMISPYSLCNVCLFSNAMMPYKSMDGMGESRL
ncbi:hypothetical protein, partial [Porphyromonas gingivalis]|uniref:hypothetical protein n=1 Tax=Porphyromonas gingivalis TaxID=837 RepID=UPI002730514F